MGQLVGCIRGIGEACVALDFPVVSGNVSLYNETSGRGILPTPTIGGVGVLADFTKSVTIAFKAAATSGCSSSVRALVCSGRRSICASCSAARTARRRRLTSRSSARNGDFVRKLIQSGRVTACHDLSDGGLGIALAEMAMAGNRGATIQMRAPQDHAHGWLFGEEQARYLVTCKEEHVQEILAEGAALKIEVCPIGLVGGDALGVERLFTIPVADLKRAHEAWLPTYMAGPG